MKIYDSGRESNLLTDIKAGRKTIEVRLNRGKFALYKPGDQVWLREDFYKDRYVVESKPRQVLVGIEKIEKYPNFRKLMESVGYEKVVPRARSIDEAMVEPYKFYSKEDETEFGILAIYFKVLKLNDNSAAQTFVARIKHS